MNEDADALQAMILDSRAMYYKRRDALNKLARLDPGMARPLLVKVLEDPEKVLRREAALLLGSHSNPAVHEALVKAFEDKDSDVRRNAAKALRESGGVSAIDALKRLAEKDDSIFVRREAEETLKVLESSPPAGPSTQAAEPAPETAGAAPKTPVSTPPWKKDREEEIKPSLEHFRTKKEESAPRQEDAPKRKETGPSRPSLTRDSLPPWKCEEKTGKAEPSLAAGMLPRKPVPPTDRVRKIREKIVPRARIEHAPRSRRGASPLPPPPAPPPAMEKISRKVRKVVATQTTGAQLCPKCQWVVKPGQRFCTFCGTPMTPASSLPAPTSPPSPFEARRSAGRRPKPPRVREGEGSPPFLKAGCIGAAVVGFIFIFFVFICVSGSSSSEPAVNTRKTPRPTRVRKTRAPKPNAREATRPGLDGPHVVIVLKNGTTVTGNLLSRTNKVFRVKSGNVTRQIPRSSVKRILYR